MTDRIDVFDSGHFAQQLLHWQANALSNLLRRGAGHLHKNVEHRNDDLRLLLSRRLENCKRPEQQSSHNHERCEFRIDKSMSDLTREAKGRERAACQFRSVIFSAHFLLLTRLDLLAAKVAAARLTDQHLTSLQAC